MSGRTNDEWLQALRHPGAQQNAALSELRDYLFRAAFIYLRDRRTDLTDYATADLREMAEDFAQDALVAIRANLDSFRGDAKFTTWAYRFVINAAAAELRRRYYRRLSFEDLAEQETAVFDTLLITHTGADPALAAERQEVIDQLIGIIRTDLNERQRIAMLAVHFQGRSIQETAEKLDTSANTVYKMLHDARKKIKAQLMARHLGAGDVLALFDDLL